MGYSISWVHCRGLILETAAARLSLTVTDRFDEYARAGISAQSLDDCSLLLVANRCNHRIAKAPALASLSADCELVACSIEEHVMYASSELWRNGRQIWRIEHCAEEGPDHLSTEVDLPDCLEPLLIECKRNLSDDQETGWFFDIPLDCAKELTGFKHDEDCPGIDYDAFRILESIGTERQWWQFWK